MPPQTIISILHKFGVKPDSVANVQSGYRNKVYTVTKDDELYNVIIFKREKNMLKTISQADRLSAHLALFHLPVRQRKDPRILQIKSKTGIQYCGLYNYLPGQTISWEGYSMNHIKLLGWVLGVVHQKSSTLAPQKETSITHHCQAQLRRMQKYFSNPGVYTALKEKLSLQIQANIWTQLRRTLQNTYRNPVMLHMDFVRGNILFDKPTKMLGQPFELGSIQLSGIIDFEKVAYGDPHHDIARTLAFLLVDCRYKQPDKITKYFIASGYHKRGRQPLPNKQALNELTTFYLLYDFYKFLLHNPYEFLSQNEHFKRTVAVLMERKILEKL